MPTASFKSVREVSSEDVVHCALNLIKQQPGKKWKTKEPGEKQAFLILELEEPFHITGIDIGNEHSAFVEVLVGKAGCTREDFTEILITCSFMTPQESKSSTNLNRVRCFNKEALVSTALPNKWQMVKIICTQPFNKHVQYGLSFIKVHVAETKSDLSSKALVPQNFLSRKLSDETMEHKKSPGIKLGKFTLREESPDSDSESTSALFGRWKKGMSTAAAIREASSTAGLRKLSNSVTTPKIEQKKASFGEENQTRKTEILDRNRENLLFGDDDLACVSAKEKELEKTIEADKERLRLESEKLKEKHKQKRNSLNKSTEQTTSKEKPRSSTKANLPGKTNSIEKANEGKEKHFIHSSKEINSVKRRSSPSSRPTKKLKAEDNTKYSPFDQLLRGVVLVISGIQNPDRADIRNKALALGARYKGDWEKGCTHLICAFKNTPKYNQVKGKGKIVTRSWIEQCYKLKKYLPWRRYALDSSESAQPESDVEILDEASKYNSIQENDIDDLDEKYTTSKDNTSISTDFYDVDLPQNISSGSDTEDEIERISTKQKENDKEKNNAETTLSRENVNVFEATTDEEDYLQEKLDMNSNDSCIFFNQLSFYISGDVSAVEKVKLNDIIKKRGGSIISDMSCANYMISDTKYKGHSKFSGETVQPLWIFECNDLGKLIPTTRYLV